MCIGFSILAGTQAQTGEQMQQKGDDCMDALNLAQEINKLNNADRDVVVALIERLAAAGAEKVSGSEG